MTKKGQTGSQNTVFERGPSLVGEMHEIVIERTLDPDPVRAEAQLAAISAEIAAGIFPAYRASRGMVYDVLSAHIDTYRRIVGTVRLRLPGGTGGIGGRKRNRGH